MIELENGYHGETLMTPYKHARELVDAAHDGDPARTGDGRAEELVYADRMEQWVACLVPDAPALLRLAARCQHLERWAVPRASFPEGKVGYHAWRSGLYRIQADRARELLLAAGVQSSEADEVALWVSKTDLRKNSGSQALEDAAILVFLEHEITGFAAQHEDYPVEKFVEILRKTWRKLSPNGRQAALTLALPPGIMALVQTAISKDSERNEGKASDSAGHSNSQPMSK